MDSNNDLGRAIGNAVETEVEVLLLTASVVASVLALAGNPEGNKFFRQVGGWRYDGLPSVCSRSYPAMTACQVGGWRFGTLKKAKSSF